jgi:hypothetical protein
VIMGSNRFVGSLGRAVRASRIHPIRGEKSVPCHD